MNRCLICFKRIEETLVDIKVCGKCLDKFKHINKVVYYKGIEIFILYEYNDFFKEVLYRFKGCYDRELKYAFLNNHLFRLRIKYRGRKIICAPSSKIDDEARGFNHIKEIASLMKLPVLDCVYKIADYKQSSKKMHEINKIQNIIRIDKTRLKAKDKILIIDDVATSLSTIKTIIQLLTTEYDIKVLILASHCRFVTDEMN